MTGARSRRPPVTTLPGLLIGLTLIAAMLGFVGLTTWLQQRQLHNLAAWQAATPEPSFWAPCRYSGSGWLILTALPAFAMRFVSDRSLKALLIAPAVATVMTEALLSTRTFYAIQQEQVLYRPQAPWSKDVRFPLTATHLAESGCVTFTHHGGSHSYHLRFSIAGPMLRNGFDLAQGVQSTSLSRWLELMRAYPNAAPPGAPTSVTHSYGLGPILVQTRNAIPPSGHLRSDPACVAYFRNRLDDNHQALFDAKFG
jgi:hypothetical protein